MSNIKLSPFAILNSKGYYDLFDQNGNKIDIPICMIRISQKAGEPDSMILSTPVNVVRDKYEMKEIINKLKE